METSSPSSVSPELYVEVLKTRVLTPDVVSVTGPSVAGDRIYIRNLREMAAFTVGGSEDPPYIGTWFGSGPM